MQLNKPKLNSGDTLILASHNKGKIEEFKHFSNHLV